VHKGSRSRVNEHFIGGVSGASNKKDSVYQSNGQVKGSLVKGHELGRDRGVIIRYAARDSKRGANLFFSIRACATLEICG